MKNVGQDLKIVKKIFQKLLPFLGGSEGKLLIFKAVVVVFLIKKLISPVTNTKNLKVVEHIHVHVLQHPTKFRAEIIIRKRAVVI